MSSLEGRLILLGVTGSIAAYKSAELARALTAAGAEVQPLMTHTAQAFLGPLTLQTLTRHRPMVDPLELLPDQRIAHIVAADTADLILVAPATARWLGAMANGLADDVVTAACLASTAPVVVAPAMDGEMYAHPATTANVEKLRSFGYAIVEPEHGSLASGQVGQGRLAEPGVILEAVSRALDGRPIRQPDPAQRPPRESSSNAGLAGWHVVVTAGGTAEPIDPVRFIGNRSTGKMGVAIAEAALARGARVTLIHGMTSVPLPEAANLVHAPTASQMRDAVLEALGEADVLVMAAAVADFRPRAASDVKIARSDGPDAGARTHERHPGRGDAGWRGATAATRSSWASRRRRARWSARAKRPSARASTCLSRTTSPRRARASARTPTASRSSSPAGRTMSGRRCPSARWPSDCSTA